MDFVLSADQQALRDGVRDFVARRYAEDALRSLTPADRDLWRDLGELGVFGLTVRESDGGAGLGVADAVLAFEELGKALVPGPLVGSALAAGHVDGAIDGERVVALLPGALEPALLEHPDLADRVAVVGATSARVVDRAEVTTQPVDAPVDPLTPMALVTEALPAGVGLDGDEWWLRGQALTAAYQLGIAQSVTDRSVAYAKEREQFGRTIGSFQAVKHLVADMFVRADLARAAVYAAGVTLDDPEVGDRARTAATAKLLADQAALLNTKTAIQVHGGMGFTWEVPVHLYYKRAWVLSTTFGTADEHALALAAGL